MNMSAVYDGVRLAARQAAQEDLQQQIDDGLFDHGGTTYVGVRIRVTPIDEAALDAWSRYWDGHPDRRFGWDWRIERTSWQTTLRRADAAIWANDELCGLMIGMRTKGRTFLRVDLLEGSPEPHHPLKGRVAYCVTEIAEAFGYAFDCGSVLLNNPVDDLIPFYEALGFEVGFTPKKVRVCVRRIA